MGLAATQMRFLALTARKSNSEYQGQQINQQRLNIANQSSNIYSTIADMTVPIPPQQATEITDENHTALTAGMVADTEDNAGNIYTVNGTTVDEPAADGGNAVPATGQYVIKLQVVTATGGTETRFYTGAKADDVYNAAYKAYEDAVTNYNSAMAKLEAESENVHQKDKKLELQLKRIDTEHSAIQTEIDAVKKILDDNVESSFKTFG